MLHILIFVLLSYAEVLVASKVTLSALLVDPSSISVVSSARTVVDSEKGIPTQLPNHGLNIAFSKQMEMMLQSVISATLKTLTGLGLTKLLQRHRLLSEVIW